MNVTMPPPAPSSAGGVTVLNGSQLTAAIDAHDTRVAKAASTPTPAALNTGLGGFIRQQWEMMRIHRDSGNGWSDRLLAAMRAFNGQYEAAKLAEIRRFSGSEVYARVIAMKCRGASSLLRDVYLSVDRPWGLDPPTDPEIPVEILNAIVQKVQSELGNLQQGGQPVSPEIARDRTMGLMEAARDAALVKAKSRARQAEDKLDVLLNEGGFYKALAEFLVDLPIFPFACIKGPVVKIMTEIDWEDGKPIQKLVPRLCWVRVAPFDLWFTPGVSDAADASFVERQRLSRADINDLLDLPGYDHKAIREVLRDYGAAGYTDTWDSSDSSRATMESRENPLWNESGLITCYEFQGNVQGVLLLDKGMPASQIPDPMRDYAIEAWMIGPHVIKVQLSPSPRRRPSYYMTSFEKVPGTPVGNALPDILHDIQDTANATLRALMNNLAMASGPQVVVNDDRLSGMENGEDMYPWKRWHVTSDPLASATQKPIEFFQPNSNAAELLGVYKAIVEMGDDQSAIPRYLQGNSPGGGAGRTASGLAMLMGNASKILQTVAANVDREVMDPALRGLLDLVLLTDTGDVLDGTEKIVVKGVAVALQRETQRSRQLELLQVTANPIDAQIMGPKGRATLLRAVSNTVGLNGAQIVPSDQEMSKQQEQAAQMAEQAGVPGHVGVGDAATDAAAEQKPMATNDMGPRENSIGPATPKRISGGVG